MLPIARQFAARGIAVLGALSLDIVAVPTQAADEARQLALGRHLAQQCTACHRIDGATTGGIPAIVGWPADQFASVLGSYKRGERTNAAMVSIAQMLDDDDMAALAAYFGSLRSAKK